MNTTRSSGTTAPQIFWGTTHDELARAQSIQTGHRRGLVLYGLYALMWLLVHGCLDAYHRQVEVSVWGAYTFYIWLGLLFGQLGSLLMWPSGPSSAAWWQHMLALLMIAGGSGLCSEVLGGSETQWWVGLVALVLGCKSAWWAMHGPTRRGLEPVRRPGTFSLSQWLIFSLWLAVLASLATCLKEEAAQSIGILACFGGLSLFVAVHRFAFQQLFWPSTDNWPNSTTGRTWQTLDRAGVFLFVLAMQGLAAWATWQYYGDTPSAGLVFCLVSTAACWQAADLWFANLVQINRRPNAMPTLVSTSTWSSYADGTLVGSTGSP